MSRSFEWTAVPEPAPDLPTGGFSLDTARWLSDGEDPNDGMPEVLHQNSVRCLEDRLWILGSLAEDRPDLSGEITDLVQMIAALRKFPSIRLEITR
jgi:hypothetical protein